MPRIAVVAACLWDLRAQCEQQLRAVTEAQRLIDRYRDRPEAQSDMKRQILSHFAAVVEAQVAANEAIADCERLILQLPATAASGRES